MCNCVKFGSFWVESRLGFDGEILTKREREMPKICTILTTTGRKKDAKKLSKVLLRKNLAACIQITCTKSHFVWENKVRKNREFLLLIKTTCKNRKKIRRIFDKAHPYKLPEFVYFKANSSKAYKKWMKSVLC